MKTVQKKAGIAALIAVTFALPGAAAEPGGNKTHAEAQLVSTSVVKPPRSNAVPQIQADALIAPVLNNETESSPNNMPYLNFETMPDPQ